MTHPEIREAMRDLGLVSEQAVRSLAGQRCRRKTTPRGLRCYQDSIGEAWCRPCRARYAVDHERADRP